MDDGSKMKVEDPTELLDFDLPALPSTLEKPYLMAAMLAERVLREEDSTLSVIRIAEAITLQHYLPPMNQMSVEELEALRQNLGEVDSGALSMVLLVRGNASDISHSFKIVANRPDQIREVLVSGSFWLTDQHENAIGSGSNIVVDIPLTSSTPTGTIWFEVFIDDQFATRVPLGVTRRVNYARPT